MRRTILGLFVDPPDDPIETVIGDEGALVIEDVQETMDGLRVYHGQASQESRESIERPVVKGEGDDAEIELVEGSKTVHKHCEWFAVPDANPGFVAFNTGDHSYARHTISMQSGGWVKPATYALDPLVESFGKKDKLDWWQVGWSEEGSEGEAGVYYPPHGAGEEITTRGLRGPKNQVGFRYLRPEDGNFIYGTVAASGYCEIYSPEDWEFLEMAEWLRSTMLEFSGVPNVGSAAEIANGEADFERACADCGREAEELREDDGDLVCLPCLDKREEDAEEPNGGTTLDDVTADGGESS